MNDLAPNTLDQTAPPLSEPTATGKVKKRVKVLQTERSERVAERLGGTLGTFTAASMLLNFVLAAAFVVALFRPPTLFLLGETDGRFFQATGPIQDANVARILMEKFSRRYVNAREKVDLKTDKERFDWVRANSTPEVWRAFDDAMSQGDFYNAAIRNKTTWDVEVVNAWQSNEDNDGIWSLDILKQHYSFGRPRGEPEPWIVVLKLGRDGRKKTPREQLDNPASLFVLGYSAYAKKDIVEGGDR